MSENELSTALLEIQHQIAGCADHWLVRNTLRQKAAMLAAAFVDAAWAEEQRFVVHPPLRNSEAMSQERVTVNGVPVPF